MMDKRREDGQEAVEEEDASSSSGSGYQQCYYERHKADLAAKAKRRWENNESGYRDRGLERAKRKRAARRAVKADTLYESRLATTKKIVGKVRVRKPRRIDLNGQRAWVYTSGAMALKAGKSPPTMRTWIEERVIPGYCFWDSGRYWFSMEFMEAVAEAVRKVLFLDGRGKLDILRRYILQELEVRGVYYIPFE